MDKNDLEDFNFFDPSINEDFKQMEKVRQGRRRALTPDEYIEFVAFFNEFINHKPKPFKKIIDKDMRL